MSTSVKAQVIARPFLKWAGGKSRLIPQYERFFPEEFKTYYEPFLGGGAIFFHLIQHRPPFEAVLTDVNPELINAYQCVKEKVEELIGLLEEHQLNHEQYQQKYYYKIRASSGKRDIERAARLIYLNKTCFNGLYRENSKGEFNVPMGRYKNPQICQADLLRSVSAALQTAKIEVRPFERILDFAQNSQDFVYFDPPYVPISSTSYFTAYSRDCFKEAEQIKLRNVFAQLAERGVKVMLSNSHSPFIKKIYSELQIFNSKKPPQIHVMLARRAINSDVNKRGRILEYLITSS